MRLTCFLQEGQLTVALTGEIDHHCANDYITTIESKIETYNPRKCILDFSEVTFMDATGIAVVINAMRVMKRLNGKLLVRGLQSQPMKVLMASGVDKLVEIEE